jgi:hypothetical protein
VCWPTAYWRPCARDALGGEPGGWPRWRRQLLEQTRALGLICAADGYGIFHRTEFALLVGGQLNDVPPGSGPWQEVGSSSLLVMLFDRTCEFETVYRNSGRKMSQPPNYLLHKGIQAAFTKSDEEPGGSGHVCTEPAFSHTNTSRSNPV